MEELPDSPPKKSKKISPVFLSFGYIIGYFITMSLSIVFILKYYNLKTSELSNTIKFSGVALNAILWILIAMPIIMKMDDQDLTRTKPTWLNSLKCYGLGVASMYGFLMVYGIILHILGIDPDKQSVAKDLQELGKSNLFLAIVGPAILIPIIEEFLFRGILYRNFKKFCTLPFSIFISAVIFGLVHQEAEVFIPLITLGIIFAWAYEKSGCIWVSIALHATNNFLSVIFLIYHDDIVKWAESVEKMNT